MAKFPVGAIVKHVSGDIRGVVEGCIEQEGRPTWYRVEWDSGDYKSHAEHELRWATTERPMMHKRPA
nr:MAG TPA: Hemimethylated DNA-binding protein YccV like protein [Caudoviricetes sp.]